jgi:hypothetical protein
MYHAHVAEADDSQSNGFHKTRPCEPLSSYATSRASSVFSQQIAAE